MGWLTPWFLLGGTAIVLPVVFHLIRRTTRERIPFGSLMFLRPSPPRLTRRSRLEHVLLLGLRAAVLALLAVGFARPFLRSTVPAAAERPSVRRVLLVDRSASMRRMGWWDAVRRRAAILLQETDVADEVAILAFDHQVRTLMSFEEWDQAAPEERRALARRRLASESPGWGGSELGQALLEAAEALEGRPGATPGARLEIRLLSDLQSGSRRQRLAGYAWPKAVRLSLERLEVPRTSNAGLQIVAESAEAPVMGGDAGVCVRVENNPDSRREQFEVGWSHSADPGTLLLAQAVYVAPGRSRRVTLRGPPAGRSVDCVVLRGDDESFDNAAYVVPPSATEVQVLHLGAGDEANPARPSFYLHRAFPGTHRFRVQVTDRAPGDDVAAVLSKATLVVASDVVPESRAEDVRNWVAAGGTALLVLADDRAGAALARMAGVPAVRVEEARPAQYALLGEIDFRHPLFAPFAETRFGDFSRIHFWKYRRVEASAIPGGQVVARFDGGDPAWLEFPVGRGRVVVLASGWHPADSQLALSSKFVPLMHALLELAGAWTPPQAHQVGDEVFVASADPSTNRAVVVTRPDGRDVSLAAGQRRVGPTELPGIYRLSAGFTPSPFAVNLDPSESRTASLSADDFAQLGITVDADGTPATPGATRAAAQRRLDLERGQKLWRWVLAAAFGVLLAETWVAGWLARRTAVSSGAVT